MPSSRSTVIATNVVVGIVQEIRAKRTLDRIALLTRPTATRRPGRGDNRASRPRSSCWATSSRSWRATRSCSTGAWSPATSGVDESQLTGETDVVRKRVGDQVFCGSFATTGAGRYVVEAVAPAASRTGSRPARGRSAASSRRSRPRSTSSSGSCSGSSSTSRCCSSSAASSSVGRWATSSPTPRCSRASSPTACSCRSPSPTPSARSGSCASGRWSSRRTRSSR